MERKVFRTRVSVLLTGIILAVFALPFVLIIRTGTYKNSAFYFAVVFFSLILTLVIYTLFSIRYGLTEKRLILRMWGDDYFTFPLSAIVSVERSYNPLSSMASSLKRLKISFKEGYKISNIVPYLIVSPAHEQEFLETLKSLSPDIQINVTDKKGWWRFWDWDI